MTNLKYLLLARTSVGDSGLKHLKPLANLWHLDIAGTKISDEGVQKLRRTLPNMQIIR